MSQNIPRKLRNWIPIESLDWNGLSVNPNAIQLLEQNLEKADYFSLLSNPNPDALRLIEKKEHAKSLLRFLPNVLVKTVKWIITPFINILNRISNPQFDVESYLLSGNPNAIHILKKEPYRISWYALCTNTNPDAMHLLESNTDKLDDLCWKILSANLNAIKLLEQNTDKINWGFLSGNMNAIRLLEQNFDKINWYTLSRNSNAIHILEKYPDRIDWGELANNLNAIKLLEQNPDRIDWQRLSYNKNAIKLLEQNQDKIDWIALSSNPNAGSLLEQNVEKIKTIKIRDTMSMIGIYISDNPGAIHLLEKNQELIHWYQLSVNPEIFTYDYVAMRESYRTMKEELIQMVWHPRRVAKWLEMGMDPGEL